MEHNFIKCRFRSHLFNDYVTDVDISDVISIDEIIAMALSSLYNVLKTNNFTSLINHLDRLNFYIKIPFEQLKFSNIETVIIYETDESDSSDESVK